MTIQETIQDMFHELITVVPKDTAILYLRKLYPQMTEKAAGMSLNRAIFDLQCNYDEATDMISMYKGPSLSKSRITAMAGAFRAAVELMDSTKQIMKCSFPFEYAVVNGTKMYEISYIFSGQETPVSLAMKMRNVAEEMRPFTRRIAIVEYGSDISYIQRVGFSKIARISVENKVEVLKSIPAEEAWLDMDED